MNDDKRDINIEGDVNAIIPNIGGTQNFNAPVSITYNSTPIVPTAKRDPRIFISYARKDAKDFALRLHDDLEAQSIDAWLDDKDILAGTTFIDAIETAIPDCDYFILVFTPHAFESENCRWEWDRALAYYKPIIPVLLLGDYDDLPRESFVYLNDAIDFRKESLYSDGIQKLTKQINIQPPLPGETRNVDKVINYSPRPELIKTLQKALTSHKTNVENNSNNEIGIGIHGMGGVGKSTLAAILADKYFIRHTFKDGIFWLTIGTTPNFKEIWSQLAEYIGHPRNDFRDAEDAKAFFGLYTKDKEYLIILDDLWEWEKEDADVFLNLGKKSRIIITSRQSDILSDFGLGTYAVDVMNDDEAQELLRQVTKLDILPAIANDVIKACGYLPLALKMIGGMIADGDNQMSRWQYAIQHLQSELDKVVVIHPYRSDMLPNLRSALGISTKNLTPDLLEFYRSFAIFPEDTLIPEDVLLTFWSNCEEATVSRNIDKLVKRHLLKRSSGLLSLHDLQRTFLRDEVGANLEQLYLDFIIAYKQQAEDRWENIPNDGYIYDHLIYHLYHAREIDQIHELLANREWVEKRVEYNPRGLLSDFEFAQTLVEDDDWARKIRYAFYNEILSNRNTHLSVPIARELVVRNLIDPEIVVKVIDRMQGSALEKTETYIEILTSSKSDYTREKIAAATIKHIIEIDQEHLEQQAEYFLQVFRFITEPTLRKKHYHVICKIFLQLNSSAKRQSFIPLFDEIKQYSNEYLEQLLKNLLSIENEYRQIYVLKQITPLFERDNINQIWQEILSKTIAIYNKHRRGKIYPVLIENLPEHIQKQAQQNILNVMWEVQSWDTPEHVNDCIVPLIPYLSNDEREIAWNRITNAYDHGDEEQQYWAGVIMAHFINHWVDRNEISSDVQVRMLSRISNSKENHYWTSKETDWVTIRLRTIHHVDSKDRNEILANLWYTACGVDGRDLASDFDEHETALQNWLFNLASKLPIEGILFLLNQSKHFFAEQEDYHHKEGYIHRNSLTALTKAIPDEIILSELESIWVDENTQWDTIRNTQPAIVELVKRVSAQELEIRLPNWLYEAFTARYYALIIAIIDSVDQDFQNKLIELYLQWVHESKTPAALEYIFRILPEQLKIKIWFELLEYNFQREIRHFDDNLLSYFHDIYFHLDEQVHVRLSKINWGVTKWEEIVTNAHPVSPYKWVLGISLLFPHLPISIQNQIKEGCIRRFENQGIGLYTPSLQELCTIFKVDECARYAKKPNLWLSEILTTNELYSKASNFIMSRVEPRKVWVVYQHHYDEMLYTEDEVAYLASQLKPQFAFQALNRAIHDKLGHPFQVGIGDITVLLYEIISSLGEFSDQSYKIIEQYIQNLKSNDIWWAEGEKWESARALVIQSLSDNKIREIFNMPHGSNQIISDELLLYEKVIIARPDQYLRLLSQHKNMFREWQHKAQTQEHSELFIWFWTIVGKSIWILSDIGSIFSYITIPVGVICLKPALWILYMLNISGENIQKKSSNAMQRIKDWIYRFLMLVIRIFISPIRFLSFLLNLVFPNQLKKVTDNIKHLPMYMAFTILGILTLPFSFIRFIYSLIFPANIRRIITYHSLPSQVVKNELETILEQDSLVENLATNRTLVYRVGGRQLAEEVAKVFQYAIWWRLRIFKAVKIPINVDSIDSTVDPKL